MTSPKYFLLTALSIAILYEIATFPAWSAPPKQANSESTQRIIPRVPVQASYAHNILVRIVAVTPIQKTDDTLLLKLEVERYYGKITTDSLNLAKKHETMRFSILFPASPDADIRPGDLINYWLVGYSPMRGGNVADNSGIVHERSPTKGE